LSNQPTYLAEIALSLIEGVGGATGRQLISYGQSAEAVFQMPVAKLLKIPQIGEVLANRISQAEAKVWVEAEKQVAWAEKLGVQCIPYFDERYPAMLKQAPDAPLILYQMGASAWQRPRTIAIVGTRQATNYGKDFVASFIRDLMPYQPVVVSGLAYGIDIAAHRACLAHQITTVAVLANGLDKVYPPQHHATAQQIVQQHGALLSESPLGTKPDAARFPARNRIIAGLVEAVVVVEAKPEGGAIITAEIANSYDREVFALPGSIHQETSAGCNHLIKTHQARLLTDVRDLVYILNWDKPVAPQNTQATLAFDLDTLGEAEQQVVKHLAKQPQQIILLDDLSWALQMPTAALSALLLQLELQGWVKTLPGKQYALVPRAPRLV